MVTANLKSSLKKAVDDALFEKSEHEQERKYLHLLQLVRLKVGDQENDIANALQEVAKELEAEGRQKDAFEFKQRTCIMLLELTMNPLPPIPPELVDAMQAQDKPASFQAKFDLHIVFDLDEAKQVYCELFELGTPDEASPDYLWWRTAHGAALCVVSGRNGAEHVPVFSTTTNNGTERLLSSGWQPACSYRTPLGEVVVFTHSRLGKFALLK